MHDYELWTNFPISDSYKLNWHDFMCDIQYHYVKMNDLSIPSSWTYRLRIYSFTCTSHITEGGSGGFRAPSHFTDLSWRYSNHVTIYSNRTV